MSRINLLFRRVDKEEHASAIPHAKLAIACFLFAVLAAAQRTPTLTTFDVPGAGTGASQGTFAASISSEGEIAGSFSDSRLVNHGFARTPHGTITTFDAPRAGTQPFQGTFPESINTKGVITGWYVNPNKI